MDTSPMDPNHSLGRGQYQASPGAHKHNGDDSELLCSGMAITGAKAGNSALTSVIALLVKLGATDSTT